MFRDQIGHVAPTMENEVAKKLEPEMEIVWFRVTVYMWKGPTIRFKLGCKLGQSPYSNSSLIWS